MPFTIAEKCSWLIISSLYLSNNLSIFIFELMSFCLCNQFCMWTLYPVTFKRKYNNFIDFYINMFCITFEKLRFETESLELFSIWFVFFLLFLLTEFLIMLISLYLFCNVTKQFAPWYNNKSRIISYNPREMMDERKRWRSSIEWLISETETHWNPLDNDCFSQKKKDHILLVLIWFIFKIMKTFKRYEI